MRSAASTLRNAVRAIALASALASSGPAVHAQSVRISDLADVDFGPLPATTGDISRSQSLCLFSSTSGGRYSITASGSGEGGAFMLRSAMGDLPFDALWASQANMSTGTLLSPNVALGQSSGAPNANCSSGNRVSASLIVVLRGTDLQAARAGSYSGTLTLLVSPN